MSTCLPRQERWRTALIVISLVIWVPIALMVALCRMHGGKR